MAFRCFALCVFFLRVVFVLFVALCVCQGVVCVCVCVSVRVCVCVFARAFVARPKIELNFKIQKPQLLLLLLSLVQQIVT